jgi:hypothetical protein
MARDDVKAIVLTGETSFSLVPPPIPRKIDEIRRDFWFVNWGSSRCLLFRRLSRDLILVFVQFAVKFADHPAISGFLGLP